jgi:hypothetical protein
MVTTVRRSTIDDPVSVAVRNPLPGSSIWYAPLESETAVCEPILTVTPDIGCPSTAFSVIPLKDPDPDPVGAVGELPPQPGTIRTNASRASRYLWNIERSQAANGVLRP